MRNFPFLFLLVIGFCVLPWQALRGLDSISEAFEAIHGSTVFPAAGMSFDDIGSTFGPRVQTSKGKYDWHRGIDMDGSIGDDILAAYDGVLYDYRYSTRGGYTIILRHELPVASNLLGSTTSKVFYTWYLHLEDDGIPGNGIGTDDIVDGWVTYVDDPANAQVITAGQHIGEMGDTGTPGGDASYKPHLHFELRWGAVSSLEFRRRYGDSSMFHAFSVFPGYLWRPAVRAVTPFHTLDGRYTAHMQVLGGPSIGAR